MFTALRQNHAKRMVLVKTFSSDTSKIALKSAGTSLVNSNQTLKPKECNKVRKEISASRRLLGIYGELSKARLSALVVMTSSAGFLLAGAPIAVDKLAAVTVGTSLAAAAANTFNQVYEVKTDGMMNRTKRRPLPSGRISKTHAAAFGTAAAVSSTALLATCCNPLTAVLGASNILLYAGIYTPLKQHHVINTWVGAIVGAIPPVMGYAAATGHICSPEAALIGSGLFLWQFPHFFSLAWMIKKDYSAGGHHMVPCFDKTGKATASILTRYSLALTALPFAAVAMDTTTSMFAIESLAFNSYLLWTVHKFRQNPSQSAARSVFRCSLWYLPLMLFCMIMHKKGWENPEQEGYSVTFGKDEWVRARPDEVMSLEEAIRRSKHYMTEMCPHEWFQTQGISTDPVLASEQHPNAYCPISTTKTKLDDCTEKTLIRNFSKTAQQ